jgi:repressor LexA
MTKALSDQQRRLLDYLRERYQARDVLPLKQQIARELRWPEGELTLAARALVAQNYIEETLDGSDGPSYRVLRDGDGNRLPPARPPYLPSARTRPRSTLDDPENADAGKPTPAEWRVLRHIHAFLRHNGYPPTLAELDSRSLTAGGTQLRNHIRSLTDKHWIDREDGSARAIRLKPCAFRALGPIVFGEAAATEASQPRIPVLGEIAAGRARYVGDETPVEGLEVPARLLRRYDRTELFAARVVGRSMVDRGLFPGDYLVIRAQPQVESGEIVAALVDEGAPGATVKAYREREGRVWLEPANAEMGLAPIPADEVTLQGKVIALLRFYEEQKVGFRIG